MRYQFYREHKYVSAALNDVERHLAQTDFCDPLSVTQALADFEQVAAMLKGHAQYEDERLHALLKAKHSSVYEHAQEDHAHIDEQLAAIRSFFDQVQAATSDEERVDFGYRLYLCYRKFSGDNLIHLDLEETEILPELQRLYTDAELQQVEKETYREMTPDQIAGMLGTLFPYMNPTDRQAFLTDIQSLAPKKFAGVWKKIQRTLSEKEQQQLARHFNFVPHTSLLDK